MPTNFCLIFYSRQIQKKRSTVLVWLNWNRTFHWWDIINIVRKFFNCALYSWIIFCYEGIRLKIGINFWNVLIMFNCWFVRKLRLNLVTILIHNNYILAKIWELPRHFFNNLLFSFRRNIKMFYHLKINILLHLLIKFNMFFAFTFFLTCRIIQPRILLIMRLHGLLRPLIDIIISLKLNNFLLWIF